MKTKKQFGKSSMKRPQRMFIIAVAGLIPAVLFMLAPGPGHRARQQATRIHIRNSMPTMSFSISTNALASGQGQKP